MNQLDPIFNMHKIKYVDLSSMIQKNCIELKKTSAFDVFINIDSIYRKMVGENIEDYIKASKKNIQYGLVANIFNLVAHYRKFFTNNKHNNRIYLYTQFPYSSTLDNESIYPNFRTHYMDSFKVSGRYGHLGVNLSEVVPLVKTIFEFIDGVYLIESQSMEASLIPYIVSKVSNRTAIRLILTEDIYDYQYVNYNGFYVIDFGNKESRLFINKNNAIDWFKIKNHYDGKETCSSIYLPFLLSVTGDRRRGLERVKKYYKIGKSIKDINNALKDNIITEDSTNINLIVKSIEPDIRNSIIRNYSMIDIKYQYEFYKNRYERIVTSQLKDRFDFNSLRTIADEYFVNNPLLIYEMNQYHRSENVFI